MSILLLKILIVPSISEEELSKPLSMFVKLSTCLFNLVKFCFMWLKLHYYDMYLIMTINIAQILK